MYLEYFGLAEKPFQITPDPRFLYLSRRHRDGFAHLLYGADQAGGFVLLTGEVGTGKTMLCRSALESITDNVRIALILNPRQSPLELVASICDELQISYPATVTSIKALIDRLNSFLLKAYGSGRRIVVVIDEAQNLTSEVLEQVRLLTNLEVSTQKLLQIILIGQPELQTVLALPELRQLSQRITARFHLTPLTREETAEYITHRLKIAGVSRQIFTRPAANEIYKISRGIPRLINTLSERALIGAYGADLPLIRKDIVRSAAQEVLGKAARADGRPTGRLMVAGVAAVCATIVFGLWGALYFDRQTDWSALIKWQTEKAPPAQAERDVNNSSEPAAEINSADVDRVNAGVPNLSIAQANSPPLMTAPVPAAQANSPSLMTAPVPAAQANSPPPMTAPVPAAQRNSPLLMTAPVPAAQANSPPLMTAPVPAAQANSPLLMTAPVPAAQANSPPPMTASVPAAQRNPLPPMTAPMPAAQANSPPPMTAPMPAVQANSPSLMTAPVPAAQRNSPPPMTASVPAAQRNSPPPMTASVPAAQRNSPPPMTASVPAAQRNPLPPMTASVPAAQRNPLPPMTAPMPAVQANSPPPMTAPVPAAQVNSPPLMAVPAAAVQANSPLLMMAPVPAAQAVPGKSAMIKAPTDLIAWLDKYADTANTFSAFTNLFALWQRDYSAYAGDTACMRAAQAGLRCIFGNNENMRVLIRYNRPAVLELKNTRQQAVFALLYRLSQNHVRLRIVDKDLQVSLTELSRHWPGNYIVLWKPPFPAHESLAKGFAGPDVLWLRHQLDQIEGKKQTPYAAENLQFDDQLESRVVEFQTRHGLKADGIVGRETFIQLVNASHSSLAPKLQSDYRG